MRSLLVLLLMAGGAQAQFLIVPVLENNSNNWIVSYDPVPPPPLTVFAEFSKPGGIDPVRASFIQNDYSYGSLGAAGLHVITAANAGSYGVSWPALNSAVVDPAYSEFAVGYNDFRQLIYWQKPLTATATEWWLRLQYYDTAATSPFGFDQLVVTTRVLGSAATFPYPEIPEPSSLLLALLAAAYPCQRRQPKPRRG